MRKVKTKRDTKQINCTKSEYLVLIINIYSALLSCRQYGVLNKMDSIQFTT